MLLSTSCAVSAVSSRLDSGRAGRWPRAAAAAPSATGVRRGVLQTRRALSDSEGREPAREDPVIARVSCNAELDLTLP